MAFERTSDYSTPGEIVKSFWVKKKGGYQMVGNRPAGTLQELGMSVSQRLRM